MARAGGAIGGTIGDKEPGDEPSRPVPGDLPAQGNAHETDRDLGKARHGLAATCRWCLHGKPHTAAACATTQRQELFGRGCVASDGAFVPKGQLALRAGRPAARLHGSDRDQSTEVLLLERPGRPIGFRINLLRSATGRAYIAFCSESERQAMLVRLVASKEPGNFMARKPAMVERLLDETRRLGYGHRTPDFGGHFDQTRREWNGGRDSIAVSGSAKR